MCKSLPSIPIYEHMKGPWISHGERLEGALGESVVSVAVEAPGRKEGVMETS